MASSSPLPRQALTPVQRVAKLTAMSAAEIGRRARYRVACQVEAWRIRRGGYDRPRFPRLLAAPWRRRTNWREELLAARRAGRRLFFAGGADRQRMQALFQSRFPDALVATTARADRVREGRASFFGEEVAVSPSTDWHADPRSGRRWPVVYHRAVPVAAGDVGYGDVKYVWELNRHQFLIDLGASYFLTANPEDARLVRAIVRAWVAQNPYGMGVNWACALEPAFRALSWLWAYYLTLDDPDFDEAVHLAWLGAFHDHGAFLHRHLEHDTSPFNHLVGEAAVLFMLGLLFPEFAESVAWTRRGRRVLEAIVVRQFHADGGSVEQSTFYHHATLGFYLMALTLAERHGVPLSGTVSAAAERALEFSMHLTQPDGSTPAIGGADDGKPIGLGHALLWDFRPYLAIGAVMFGRGDFQRAAGRCWEDAVWLLGPAALDTFDHQSPAEPPLSVTLPRSGYAVARSAWRADADFVCVDCGPQAAGLRRDHIASAAHGHADALSVVAWLGGRPVLVDSGFFCYNGDPEWEVHFRRTAAHNTARVDGRDQAQHVCKMSWCSTYHARFLGTGGAAGHLWVCGSHDGYARGPHPVTHRRTVWLRDGYLLLLDEFEGEGRHDLDLHFHFPPGRAQLVDGRLTHDGHDAALVWVSASEWQPALTCGGPSPADGWMAPGLGVKTPAPHLRLHRSAADLPISVLSLAVDRRRVTLVECRSTPLGLHAHVAGPAGQDALLAPSRAGRSFGDAPVLLWRRRGTSWAPERAGGSFVAAAPPADGPSPDDSGSTGART